MTSSSVSSSSPAVMLIPRHGVGPEPWGLNSHPTEGVQETVSSASSTRSSTHHPHSRLSPHVLELVGCFVSRRL